MHKVQIHPIRRVDPVSDCSLLTMENTLPSEKSILLHRIQILELENQDLRKREQYLKMINTSLIEALGCKDTLKSMIDRLAPETCSGSDNDTCIDHSNKMNSFKKKNKERRINLQEAHRRSIETVYESGDQDPNTSSKKFEEFNDNYSTFKEQQILIDQRDHFRSKDREKAFSKTKSPSYFQSQEYKDIFKNKSYTPKVKNQKLSINNSNMRKSVNNLVQPLQLHNSFSKKDIYVLNSSRSQRSPISNHSYANNNKKRNIATGLLCDLCGMSYSPVDFMSHAQKCQTNHQNQDHELIKITDKSYQQDDTDSDNEDLLINLQNEKRDLLSQIKQLKKSRKIPEKKQRNMDQIVFIVNSKKNLNQNSIKNLLKQKNTTFTAVTSRKRERI